MTFFPTRLQVQWAPSRTLRAANSVVVTFVVVRHRSSAARLHRQSDVTNRALPSIESDFVAIDQSAQPRALEAGQGFFDPVFVWITLIRGLTVRTCSEA